MKKVMIVAILLSGTVAMAQTKSAPAQSPNGAPPVTRPQANSEMRERMMEMREQRMAQMQQQQMREMQPAMDAMRRKVSLLGSELLSVQDVNTRRALQTDMELWQQLLETMQRHMQSMGMQDHMMPPMPGPGMHQPPPAPKSQQPQPHN